MSLNLYATFIAILFSHIFIQNDGVAQIHINTGYNNLSIENEQSTGVLFNETLRGWSIEGAYWFRLKDYRVEFFPGLGYSSLRAGNNSLFTDYQLNLIHIFWATRIYPFTFEDDCMCPTFNKQSGFFEDGFFVSLTPHLLFTEQSTSFPINGNQDVKSNTYLVDLGAGIDVGISKFITITPEVRYRFSGSFNSVPFENSEIVDFDKSSFNGWYFGIGLGLRWKS